MTKWPKELGSWKTDVVDVQQERLESAEKHLSTAKSKCKVFACECTEKEKQIEKLGGFCQTAKKKLLYTEDAGSPRRETPKGLCNLDTS